MQNPLNGFDPRLKPNKRRTPELRGVEFIRQDFIHSHRAPHRGRGLSAREPSVRQFLRQREAARFHPLDKSGMNHPVILAFPRGRMDGNPREKLLD